MLTKLLARLRDSSLILPACATIAMLVMIAVIWTTTPHGSNNLLDHPLGPDDPYQKMGQGLMVVGVVCYLSLWAAVRFLRYLRRKLREQSSWMK